MRVGAIVGNLGLPHDVEISAFALSGRNIGVHGNPTPVCAYLPKLLGAMSGIFPAQIKQCAAFSWLPCIEGTMGSG